MPTPELQFVIEVCRLTQTTIGKVLKASGDRAGDKSNQTDLDLRRRIRKAHYSLCARRVGRANFGTTERFDEAANSRTKMGEGQTQNRPPTTRRGVCEERGIEQWRRDNKQSRSWARS